MARTLALILSLLAVAAPAAAEQVEFGWRSDVEYDSRVTSRDGGLDDVIFRFGPTFAWSGDHRRFNYRIEQASRFEKYGEIEAINGWEHRLDVSATAAINRFMTLRVSNNFAQIPRVTSGSDLDPDGLIVLPDEDPGLNLDSGTLTNNSFTASLAVMPVERALFVTSVSHLFREFDDPNPNAQDTSAVTSETNATYDLFKDHTFGAGFRFTQRDFSASSRNDDDDNRSDTYQVYGMWNWQIDERTTFNMRAGPAWTDDDLNPPLTPAAAVLQDGFLPATAPIPIFLIPLPVCQLVPTSSYEVAPELEFFTIADVGGMDVVFPGFILGDCEPSTVQPQLTPAQQEIIAGLQPLGRIPGFGDVENEAAVNVFLQMSLEREWDRVDSRLSWIRRDDQTRGFGSATVVDSFLAQLRYHLNARTRVSAEFRFSRRETDLDRKVRTPVYGPFQFPAAALYPGVSGLPAGLELFPIISTIESDQRVQQTIDNYRLQFGLSRDLSARSEGFMRLILRRQESEFSSELGALSSSNEITNEQWQFLMGFNYRFRPIRVF